MLNFYQHLPKMINPVAFSLGIFSIRWYSIMYIIGFSVVYALLKWRISYDCEDGKFSIFNPPAGGQFFQPTADPPMAENKTEKQNFLNDLFLYSIIGMLAGARIGYALFYDFSYYLHNPLEIISPYNFSTHQFTGLYGMSYFGGLIGIIIVGIIFTKTYKIYPVKSAKGGSVIPKFNRVNFWQLADWVIPAIPAGYFFGRIGNFLNGELYGRVTDKFWGMYFPLDFSQNLRYPSQLFEAFFEGLVLFVILWIFRKKALFPGFLLALYLFGYGFFRFFIEFVREPDPQVSLIFNFLTLGQIFSVFLMLIAGGIYLWKRKKKMV
jgi:phosphatidylglycerol:prolipoprotein diacylglycerol transferase